MRVVSVSQAKNRLSELLKKVRGGATVTITDRGVPVARLVPPASTAGVPPGMIALAQRGVLRLPDREPTPDWFAGEVVVPDGELGNAAIDALLDERRTGR